MELTRQQALERIDEYEGVSSGLYERVIKKINLNEYDEEIKAYIYVGKKIGKYEELDTGDWNIEKEKLNL